MFSKLTKREVIGSMGIHWFRYQDDHFEYETCTEEEYHALGNSQPKREGALWSKSELVFKVDTSDGFLGDNEYTIHQGHVFVQLPKKGALPSQTTDGFKKLPLGAIVEDRLVQ